jgi:hypothetical protein
MFSRFSNKNWTLKNPNGTVKIEFFLADGELTVLSSTLRKLGCVESTVLPEEPFLSLGLEQFLHFFAPMSVTNKDLGARSGHKSDPSATE